MKKIIAAVTTLTAGLVMSLGFASPAAHAGSFNDLYHAVDDTGYTASIRIICGDGRVRWLAKGESSPSKCGAHVARVAPQANQMVTCYNTLPPYQRLTYWEGNTRDLPSWSSLRCYMQRPI